MSEFKNNNFFMVKTLNLQRGKWGKFKPHVSLVGFLYY
jgi:hypothetical protein